MLVATSKADPPFATCNAVVALTDLSSRLYTRIGETADYGAAADLPKNGDGECTVEAARS